MLKLQRLEISGFKSFPDPVTLHFAGGITAIVGPNGCGKSNLSEAMTWVLGEQSAKSLRSGTMEDVIFNGSQQRKPLGMGEATLVLEADPSMEQAEDGRITIGRRVFRDGQSQYRMNGKVVRMKDIKHFLMDTGLGIRAYSVIEQGKIGMILSGKPQERRKLLEEAAGITRYKARKRVAEMKLEESVANLMRLEDVVGEVERSLRSLKRQASAARRYQKKQEEFRILLRKVLAARSKNLLERLDVLEGRLATVTDRDAELTRELAHREATLAEGRETLDSMAERVAELHQRQADLAATIEGRQEYLKATRRTLSEITERAAQGRALSERKQGDLERWREELAQAQDKRQGMVDDLDAASTQVDQDTAQIAAAEQALQEAAARVENLRRKMLEQVDLLNRLSNRHQRAEIELEKGNDRRRRLRDELEEHRGEMGQSAESVETTRQTVHDLDEKIAAQKTELEKIARALEVTMRREAEASDHRRELEDGLSEARQRRRLLQELAEAYAERRARLESTLAEAGLGEPTFLAQRVSAVEGWERSLDVFLGELTDAVVLDHGDATLPLAHTLAEGESRARLVAPLDSIPESLPRVDTLDDPAVVLSLGEALQLSEELAAALPPAFLVESPEDAERLARRHPGISFLSREGLWAQGGMVHVEARKAAPGVFERERELAELEETIPDLEDRLETAKTDLQRLVEQRSGLAKDQNRHQGELAQAQQERAVAHARLEDLEQRHERLSNEESEILQELGTLDEQITEATETRTSLAGERSEAEAEHESLKERFDRAQAEVDAAKAERESLRTASADRRGRLELLKERLASHDREIGRLQSEIDEGERQMGSWKEEAERLERRKLELESGLETAEIELQEALEKRSGGQDDVIAAQERLDHQREELKELEKTLAQVRERRDEVRTELEEIRIERAELRQEGGHLAAQYEEHFGDKPEPEAADEEPEAEDDVEGGEDPTPRLEAANDAEAVREVDETEETAETAEAAAANEDEDQDDVPEVPPRPWPEVLAEAAQLLGEETEDGEDDDRTLPQLEGELSRTKAALERLGPVNVLAVEEYEEQQERHEFLITQRSDVEESVERLRKTIREINATSSERFLATFEEVNRSFGETFQRLFRGGEAEMRLMDDEDVLETGIEIVARPPGKRLQNLMLLSGGEKALTAVALLFALFQTKPSPFCILDEVDAPLDDVNCVRFVEMLQEMSHDTQFVIITHNKITMEAAATLYGVTMEEKGVSKLVSVEIEDVQPQAMTA